MATTYINVIVIKNGVVDDNILFVGENEIIASGIHAGKDQAKVAEDQFIRSCKLLDPDFDLEGEEIDDLIEAGYYEGEHGSVCLSWPFKQT